MSKISGDCKKCHDNVTSIFASSVTSVICHHSLSESEKDGLSPLEHKNTSVLYSDHYVFITRILQGGWLGTSL